MESGFDLLVERGFVYQSSNDQALRAALARPLTLYCGYDPTANSLTVGHLVPIMMLAHLQRAGHHPIALVGGGTTMVGDPTGKAEARVMMTKEQIATNQEAIKGQLAHYLDFSPASPVQARMVNNADWLMKLGYIDFLREIGRHFSVNQMLQHETYRDRLQGSGLSFIEMNYVLLQAYDFLHLYREYGCTLQVGGTDQWFNILAGAELIRRADGGEAFALVAPLITTASGAKMGKTEAGAVWLSPERTTPYAFYQFWVNTEDADVGRFLRLFTFFAADEIARLADLGGAELRTAKEILAFEVTRIVHGEAAATEAQQAARALFGGEGGSLEHVPTTALPSDRLAEGIEVVELLVLGALASSKSSARQLIKQGGVSLGDRRVETPDVRITREQIGEQGILLRAGKKRFHRFVSSV
ncbi:MAG: tyrosine--tRNA ligase [Chloroflexi bacterium]|nr:tyrosine--tRNA ligase [Chloroflexota bacterium]